LLDFLLTTTTGSVYWVNESRRYLLHKSSYCLLSQISLTLQQRSVVVEFVGRHSIARPRKPDWLHGS